MNRKRIESKMLGVELPFDWVLIRGKKLRAMQTEIREARHSLTVDSLLIAKLLGQIYPEQAQRHKGTR